jgi:hypothetical protein
MIALPVFAQRTSVQIPTATPLQVQLSKSVAMRRGIALQGSLMYPVYAENQLVIPTGSVLRGSILALEPDSNRRIHARLRGDFTPFHCPVVRFDQLVLPDGSTKQIVTDNARNGAPVLHLSTPASATPHSPLWRQISGFKQQAKAAVNWVLAPGRGDRFVQLLYSQLPYHPERIEPATRWTVTLAQPLTLIPNVASAKAEPDRPVEPVAFGKSQPTSFPKAEASSGGRSVWQIRAYLDGTISSANQKQGNTFAAVVAEPVFQSDHALAVPQGALLVGTITQVKPARSFGRAGKLRFSFSELRLPGGLPQHVQGTLTAVDASKSQNLQLDAEGGVQQTPTARITVPTALTLLAARAFDEDGNRVVNATIGANGFGIVGRVAGIVAGSRYLAGTLGFYGAGLSFYDCCLARGQDVVFVKGTRIEVTLTLNPIPLVGPKLGPSPSGNH